MIEIFVIFIIVILLGFYNGFFILHLKTQDKKHSDSWHKVGWIIRALPIFVLYPLGSWILLYTIFAWIIYDIIIAKMLNKKWYYQGNTSIMERTIPHWILYAGKIILLILTIISWVKKIYF